MSYQIKAVLNPTDAPTDKQSLFESWATEFDSLTHDYTEYTANNTNTRPAYDELTARFDYTTDIDTVIDSLKTEYYPNAEWFAIFKRSDAYESNTDTYLTDPTYYSPNKTDGLTVPLTLSTDGHTLEYDAIDYLIDETAYHIDSGSLKLDKPKDTKQTKTLYADANQSLNFSSGLKLASIEVHPAKVVVKETANVEWPTTDYDTPVFTRGSPPTPFIDPDTSWPTPSYVTQEGVSQPTIDAILAAKEKGDTQAQIDHILDILDVIDL